MFKPRKIKLMITVLFSGVMLAACVLVPRAPLQATGIDGLTVHFAQTERKSALARDGNCDTKPKDDESTGQGAPLTKDNCTIVKYIITFINALSAIVGIVVVIMIVVGGIQYSASRDNPQATAAAKGRIVNAVIALVFFLFAFAFLQWIVPGGAFSS